MSQNRPGILTSILNAIDIFLLTPPTPSHRDKYLFLAIRFLFIYSLIQWQCLIFLKSRYCRHMVYTCVVCALGTGHLYTRRS